MTLNRAAKQRNERKVTEFPIHTDETAPPGGAEALTACKQKYGMVPNMMAAMAESPEILSAYLTMSGLWAKTTFSPLERDVVLLAINHENACRYCMASQSAVSARGGMAPEILSALRSGSLLPDEKLQALRAFTVAVVRERGWVDAAAIETFLAAGYTKRNVFEVILAASFKTLSNYTDHVTHTPVDKVFEEFAWRRDAG